LAKSALFILFLNFKEGLFITTVTI